ncbi:MAG TPA: choice-of-anchor Q domain-containing protein, partial [Gammaproteobacteria bacterium]|nr:choice-of-anchor Q domain-containing protein [Gammaproteobacteria bacterium]
MHAQRSGAILNLMLARNVGPTKTHALVAGRPAVDSVNDGTCPPPAMDQRGIKRPQDGTGNGGPACNRGHYELVGETSPTAATCHGLTAVIMGTAAGEIFMGTAGRDLTQGLGGADL